MYDVELVEAICRRFGRERRNSRRANALLDLLHAVVLEQIPETHPNPIALIEVDTPGGIRGLN